MIERDDDDDFPGSGRIPSWLWTEIAAAAVFLLVVAGATLNWSEYHTTKEACPPFVALFC